MKDVEVGMGPEGTPIGGTDYFLPFFITASEGQHVPSRLNEDSVRSAFGNVIASECRVWVEPVEERWQWWEGVLLWYSDSEEADVIEALKAWRKMIKWFHSQKELHEPTVVMIGNGPEDGGAHCLRPVVGTTRVGSLVGIAGTGTYIRTVFEQGTAAERIHLRRSATVVRVIQSNVIQPITPSARAVTAVPTVGRTKAIHCL